MASVLNLRHKIEDALPPDLPAAKGTGWGHPPTPTTFQMLVQLENIEEQEDKHKPPSS